MLQSEKDRVFIGLLGGLPAGVSKKSRKLLDDVLVENVSNRHRSKYQVLRFLFILAEKRLAFQAE